VVSALREIVCVVDASCAAPFPYVRNVMDARIVPGSELAEARLTITTEVMAR
jgi:hypothetical protein